MLSYCNYFVLKSVMMVITGEANETLQARKTALREQVLRSKLTSFLSNHLSVAGVEPGLKKTDINQPLVSTSETFPRGYWMPTNVLCSGQFYAVRDTYGAVRLHEDEMSTTNPERVILRRVWRPGEEIPSILSF